MLRLLLGLFLLASPALLAGCDSILGTDERMVTWYVAPEKVPCQGLIPAECLQGRESLDAPWEGLHDSISGFDWEYGYLYRIRVAIREIDDPPADGSSLEYRLVRVLEKKVVPVPA